MEAVAVRHAGGILRALVLALFLVKGVCKVSWQHVALRIGAEAFSNLCELRGVKLMAYALALDAHVPVGLFVAVSAPQPFWTWFNHTLSSEWVACRVFVAKTARRRAILVCTTVQDFSPAEPSGTGAIWGYAWCAVARYPIRPLHEDACTRARVAGSLCYQAGIVRIALHQILETPVHPSDARASFALIVVRVMLAVCARSSIHSECVVAFAGTLLASAVRLTGIGERTRNILHEAHVGCTPLVLSTLAALSVVLAFLANLLARIFRERIRFWYVASEHRCARASVGLPEYAAPHVALALLKVPAVSHTLCARL